MDQCTKEKQAFNSSKWFTRFNDILTCHSSIFRFKPITSRNSLALNWTSMVMKVSLNEEQLRFVKELEFGLRK